MADFWYHDGSAVRKATALHYHDGSAVRNIQKAYYHDGSAVRLIFSPATIVVPSGEVWSISSALVRFSTDGSVTTDGSSTVQPQYWRTPLSAGIGSGYWIRADLFSGINPTSGGMNTWFSLAANQAWSNTGSPTFARSSTISFSIAPDVAGAPGAIVAQGYITLTKETNL